MEKKPVGKYWWATFAICFSSLYNLLDYYCGSILETVGTFQKHWAERKKEMSVFEANSTFSSSVIHQTQIEQFFV